MAIVNGVSANQTNFNNAFVSRTQNTSTVGVLNLNNTSDVNSGAQIVNTQRALNELFNAVGMTGEGDATRNTYSSNNVVLNGTSRKVAISALDAEFNTSTGHDHDGGNSKAISAANLSNLNYYKAQWSTFDFTSASGLSIDVTSTFTLETPGGGVGIEGVVTSPPYNKCEVRHKDTLTFIEDAQGQRVYAKLTESSGTWTLSFYTNEAGVETAHTLSSQDITIFYRKVFSLANIPTFNEDAGLIASLDLTADIATATETVEGKTLLSNIVATSIGSTNVKGTSSRVSHEDHAHQGLHAVQEFTEAVNVFGDIVLKSGTNITITRTGQTFEFAAPGGGGANTSLSNLIATSINQSLVPDSDIAYDLGASGAAWSVLYIDEITDTAASKYISFDGLVEVLSDVDIQLNATNEIILNSNAYVALRNSNATAATPLRFYDDNNSNYVAFKSAGTVATDVTWTLPNADGTSGQLLSTNGSGVLSWSTVTSGANTALSNLTATSLNQDLIFAAGISGGLRSRDNSDNDAVATGSVDITSGDKTSGTGDSGSVDIRTGTSFGGLRGYINLNDYVHLRKTTNTTNVWGGDFIGFGVNGSNTDISTVSFGSGMFLEEGALYLGMITGDITSGATQTSDIWIATGYQTDTGNTGNITIQVGVSSGGSGGTLNLSAGDGDTQGGSVSITGGDSTSGNAGNIALNPGLGSGSVPGRVTSGGPLKFANYASAPSSPTSGEVYYDTTLQKLRVYTTAWETITSV